MELDECFRTIVASVIVKADREIVGRNIIIIRSPSCVSSPRSFGRPSGVGCRKFDAQHFVYVHTTRTHTCVSKMWAHVNNTDHFYLPGKPVLGKILLVVHWRWVGEQLASGSRRGLNVSNSFCRF